VSYLDVPPTIKVRASSIGGLPDSVVWFSPVNRWVQERFMRLFTRSLAVFNSSGGYKSEVVKRVSTKVK
jgi:hypothetical protein